MRSATEPTDAIQYLQRIIQDPVQLITQPTNISGSSNRSTPGSMATITIHQNSSPSAAPANNGRAELPGQKSSDVNYPQIPIPQSPSFSSNPLKRPGENFRDREKLKQIRSKNHEGMKRIQERKKRIEEQMRALIDKEEKRGLEVRRCILQEILSLADIANRLRRKTSGYKK